MTRRFTTTLITGLLLAGGSFVPAMAQSIDYGDTSQGSESPGEGDRGAGGESSLKRSRPDERGTFLEPYIEVAQVVTARNVPENETFTYTRVAVGADASMVGKRSGGSVSLRYERRIDWGHEDAAGDLASGIASGYATVAPGVQFHAGGLATRERFGRDGASVPGSPFAGDQIVQVYSVYAGPAVSTMAGDVALNANYRIGYSKVEQENARIVSPDGPAEDIFDDSIVHSASVSATLKPGEVLPVGIGTSGSYYREDVANLDQRVEDMQAKAIVTVPVSPSLSVSGAVGYERVEISSRDAVRGSDGVPVVGRGGNYVTDKSVPRILAYDVDGLIWDAGVMWRPSRRTALSANVGRRYGSTSITGTFRYAPNRHTSLNFAVYDNVAGFGGELNRALALLPTDFAAIRDPLTGDISGCVSSLEDGSCLSGALGSLRSSAFRARGVAANYAVRLGRLSAGLGGGYDRRKFIAAPGTVLAISDGAVDENYWLVAYLTAEMNKHSSLETNFYANWIESGGTFSGDTKAWGATAAYHRRLTSHISARAALGIEGLSESDLPEDYWTASALVGVRYRF
ncbi:MAG: preprotein translocase subunit YajC [Sphingomonadaceae bacterium]|nr:preprotein translocase subunit YajC [Sphingomonadaceae bacterium]